MLCCAKLLIYGYIEGINDYGYKETRSFHRGSCCPLALPRRFESLHRCLMAPQLTQLLKFLFDILSCRVSAGFNRAFPASYASACCFELPLRASFDLRTNDAFDLDKYNNGFMLN